MKIFRRGYCVIPLNASLPFLMSSLSSDVGSLRTFCVRFIWPHFPKDANSFFLAMLQCIGGNCEDEMISVFQDISSLSSFCPSVEIFVFVYLQQLNDQENNF